MSPLEAFVTPPPLRVGTSISSAPPLERVGRQVRRARENGFDSFWWQDHLLGFASEQLWRTCAASEVVRSPHAVVDPFVAMSVAAVEAGSGLIGVCVTDPIRRMPATIVQTAMTLDYLAPGRVVIGLGSGEPLNYRPFGWDIPSPLSRLRGAAHQMRHFLDSPTPDENGGMMALRPPEGSSGPQLWISAHGPKAQEVAGRYGDGWLCAIGHVPTWEEGRARVLRAAESAGRNPSSLTCATSLLVAVSEDPGVVHRVLDHPVTKANFLTLPQRYYEEVGSKNPLGDGLQNLMPGAMDSELVEAASRIPLSLSQGHIPHGSPQQVADRIRQFKGIDHVILWDILPIIEPTMARESASRCAEVARLLKDHSS